MKATNRFLIFLTGAFLASGANFADDDSIRQDAKAIDVLQSTSAYAATLDRVAIKGTSFHDARLGEGLMVSNATEVKIFIDRPASLRISSFDGKEHLDLFFHDKVLTVFNKERGYYAQAPIPEDIETALEFALDELDIDAPMMDLIMADVSVNLIGSQEPVLYLTDKARVSGQDCHHIAIGGPETDVLLWIDEGDQPLPRKFMMTSKWEGGSPRVITNMKWDTDPGFKQDVFKFEAPEGAVNIGFVSNLMGGGE